jgi:hypothetical protein
MSLLYQALLKNSQNQSSTNNTSDMSEDNSIPKSVATKQNYSALLTSQSNVDNNQANAFTTNRFTNIAQGYPNNASSVPWLVWIFIASLLLIVGLLAGYIYGNASLLGQSEANYKLAAIDTQVNNSQMTPLLSMSSMQKTEQVKPNEVLPSKKNDEPPITNKSLALSGDGAEALPEQITQTQNKSDEINVTDDKTIEIALDAQGQVVSKVSTSKEDKVPSAQTTEDIQTRTDSKVNMVIDSDNDNSETDNQMALSEVSDKIKASFAEAIKATEKSPTQDDNFQVNLYSNDDLLMLEDLTVYQSKTLPDLIYQMHIFASDASERWVRINGKTLYEGQTLQAGLTLLEIKQDLIVWRHNNMKIGQVALVDFVKI